ncbi:MAG: hypothetical protein AAFN42_11280 [Cyanobacteria bacterium J06554_1]
MVVSLEREDQELDKSYQTFLKCLQHQNRSVYMQGLEDFYALCFDAL